uniref:Uncharacterized protein n=1 Tax=uncultured Chloroflexi bacterium HF0200_09I09 TaxID=710736 RepID=E0XU73_9CHLR|nr:hypothetical protein [uncultured Chloroflexi bacterium HF0200_09I09]
MSNRPARPILPGHPSCLRHNFGGAGILTCCPSPTTLVLGLGPPNPTWINLA